MLFFLSIHDVFNGHETVLREQVFKTVARVFIKTY